MDVGRKRKETASDSCSNMITNVRQLRLSVLDLFNTLADGGVDPEKYQPAYQHHHDKIRHPQTMAAIATIHSLCSASSSNRLTDDVELEKRKKVATIEKKQIELINYVTHTISSITNTIRSLDQDLAVLMQNSSSINTGESVHLAIDSSLDKHNLYVDLCQSYKTYSKLHDYSFLCHGLLHQQSLKRVHKRVETSSNGSQARASGAEATAPRSESIVATFNPYIYKICLSKQAVTSILETCLKTCEFMEGVYSQPFGISTGVFQISVNRVLKAILVMRGIVIDAVIVKAYHESFANKASRAGSSAALLAASDLAGGGSQFVDPDDDIDLWSESKYNVFRRLTHHANAAVLHFQYPTYPEIAVRSFLMAPVISREKLGTNLGPTLMLTNPEFSHCAQIPSLSPLA